MNELHVSVATVLDSAPERDALPLADAPRVTEFVGSSDDTIAEAVRRALSRASTSLRTLDGAGVVVIPQIDRHGTSPRFQVTLRVSQSAPTPSA
jgi:flavin-binding protein dodecin